mgnify:CR=1 FL=1
MKDCFSSYYRKSNELLQELWNKALFVLDASVLLKLYELTPATRREFMNALKHIANRIWIPYEAISEYQRNRIRVIQKQLKMADTVLGTLKQIKKNVRNALPKEHPFVDANSVEEIIKACQRAITKLKRREGEYRRLLEHDVIREELDRLLSGWIGEPYDTDRLIEICEIAQKRYRARIPPGYADENKVEGNPFGDVIIWFQIIDKARVEKRPIILVTDDRKEDWWVCDASGELTPRQELVDEIKQKAGVELLMYTPETFLKDFGVYLKQKVPKRTIEELTYLTAWEHVESLERLVSQIQAQLTSIPQIDLALFAAMYNSVQKAAEQTQPLSTAQIQALEKYLSQLSNFPLVVPPWMNILSPKEKRTESGDRDTESKENS